MQRKKASFIFREIIFGAPDFFYYMPSYGEYREYTINKILGKKNDFYYGDLYMRPSYDDFQWEGHRVVTVSLDNGELKQNGGKVRLSYFSDESNICFIVILPEESESISRYWRMIYELDRISKNKLIFCPHKASELVEEEELLINEKLSVP